METKDKFTFKASKEGYMSSYYNAVCYRIWTLVVNGEETDIVIRDNPLLANAFLVGNVVCRSLRVAKTEAIEQYQSKGLRPVSCD